MEDSIKAEIEYCEQKAKEYLIDCKNNTGGSAEFWRGKSEVHKYMAIRLRRVLNFHRTKPLENER